MSKIKKKGGLYNYLKERGLDTCEDDTLLELTKREYWREYDKNLKHRKRKIEKRAFTISFPKDEMPNIKRNASQSGYSLHEYIKQCVFASIRNTYVIPHLYAYKEILQQISSCKNILNSLQEKDKGLWASFGNYEKAFNTIQELKLSIQNTMYNAEPLEVHIKNAIRNNASYLSYLQNLIKTAYGNQEYEPKD